MADSHSIPLGFCHCGCGEPTALARLTRRGHVKGQPLSYINGHQNRGRQFQDRPIQQGYRSIGNARLHRIRAERALGKPLPPRAEVHHADGSKRDDAPLVICQDHAYHLLLHVRMRVVRAGGNPNTDAACSTCHLAKHRDEFRLKDSATFGVRSDCRACENERNASRYINGSKKIQFVKKEQ